MPLDFLIFDKGIHFKGMNMIGIYKITSPDGRIYIGQSIDIEKRFKQYRSWNKKFTAPLYMSFKYHGVYAHDFEVITECSVDDLNINEYKYYSYYKSKGYVMMNSNTPSTGPTIKPSKQKWRPIKGCSNYAISSHGQVKRLKHRSVGKLYRILDEMVIEPQMNRQGVVYANIRDDSGKKMTVAIQRLVIQTFGTSGVTYYRINPDPFDNRFDHFVREDVYPRMTDQPVIIKKIKVK